MAMIKSSNIKKGSYILFKNEPHEVTKTEFYAPGKGSAITRMKLKSVRTGNTVEFTYKSNESIEELDVMAKEMQFLFIDTDDVVFMDPRSYEQVSVSKNLMEGKIGYLIPELTMYLVFYEDNVIGVRFPQKVKLKVVEASDAVAGNTVNAAKKPVSLETGITVFAPLFVKTGDTLIIETENGEYVSRG